MARGHSESAHNVFVDDYPVGPQTTRTVADLHTGGRDWYRDHGRERE